MFGGVGNIGIPSSLGSVMGQGGAVLPILNQLSVQPAVAWSMGRVLKSGKSPISGTPAALTKVLDQSGNGNDLTPVNFSALETEQIQGASTASGAIALSAAKDWHLNANASLHHFTMASTLTIPGSCTFAGAVVVGTNNSAQSPILGNTATGAPSFRIYQTQAIISFGTTVNLVGAWTLVAGEAVWFCCTVDAVTGVATLEINGEVWATTTNTALKAGDAGRTTNAFNCVMRRQGDYFNGGLLDLMVFQSVLSAGDKEILRADGEPANRTAFYVDPDKTDNTGLACTPGRAWANDNLFNSITSSLAARPGTATLFKKGSAAGIIRNSPYLRSGAGQAGTLLKPNIAGGYGIGARPRFRYSTQAAGPWTLESGTIFSMAWVPTLANTIMGYWLKTYTNPLDLHNDYLTAFMAALTLRRAGNTTAVPDFTVPRSRLSQILVDTSTAVGLNKFYVSGGKLYLNIGQDPTGQSIEMSVLLGGLVRGGQLAADYNYVQDAFDLEFAPEDAIANSGNHNHWDDVMSVGGNGDAFGGKGGSDHVIERFSLMLSGQGKQQSGSNGDIGSEHANYTYQHGSLKGTSYAWDGGKASIDSPSQQGSVINVMMAGAPTCIWVPDFVGVSDPGTTTITNCIAMLMGESLELPCVRAEATVGGTLILNGGEYYGCPTSPNNTFLSIPSGSAMRVVLNQVKRQGFATDIRNFGTIGPSAVTDNP